MAAPVLTRDALNRATLARQMLLERAAVQPLQALERLGGLQAQLPRPPVVGLWTRLQDFRREALVALARDRQAVRATLMRGTLHLVSAVDYLRLRATLHPVLEGALLYAKAHLPGLDLEGTLRAARELLEERPRTFDEIRPALVERGLPGNDRAMGLAVRMLLPLVQVPSGDGWGYDAKAPFTLAEPWLGSPLSPEADLPELVRRYLAAFGPASPADAGAWSGLRGLRAVFEALRGELLVFRDESGRELFDLPAAPRPGEEVEAPVRFLPEFDSLLLAHDDRSRVLEREHRPRVVSRNLQVAATFLVEGRVAGTWKGEVRRGEASLVLRPFRTLAPGEVQALEAEAAPLLHFLYPAAREHAMRVEAAAA